MAATRRKTGKIHRRREGLVGRILAVRREERAGEVGYNEKGGASRQEGLGDGRSSQSLGL